ncbi:MAG: anti-sigma factor [Sphingomonadaceae bacterium]
MNRIDPELLDLVAAEFVLGTLTGGARRRFERWRRADAFVDRRTQAWEQRLAGLTLALEPVAPSPGVWTSIERRIGPARSGPGRLLAAAVAAVALIGIGWLLWQELHIGTPQAEAVIADQAGVTLWRVAVAEDGDRLLVSTIGSVRVPDQRSLELWALPAEAAPVSLGLMPASGRKRIALDDRQRAALATAANVAVSEEPRGGSPTGAPTGPVVYVAALARS